MPGLNIKNHLKTKIDAQPERKRPLLLSRDKMAELLMLEAIERRASTNQRKPRQ